MKKFILIIFFFCITVTLCAKIYLRQNSFYVPESITMEAARVRAVSEIKSQLIREIFSYAKFTTLWNTIDRSDTLSNNNIEILKTKVSLKDIIEESRDDNVYYINAEFQADENVIMDDFRKIFSEDEEKKNLVQTETIQPDSEQEKPVEYQAILPKHMQQEEPSPTTLTLTGDAYEYFRKALEAQNLKLYQDALSWYERSLEKNPNNAQAHNNMGIILSMLGAHEAAIEHFKEAKNINPELPQVYNNLGNAQESIGQLNEAIKTYEMAISVQPNYADGYYNLAGVYTEMREFDKAESSLSKLLEIDKKNPYAYYGMGNMYAKKRDFDEAVQWYKKAIDLQPNFAEAHYKIGLTYGLQGDMDVGIKHINKANSLGYSYEEGIVVGDSSHVQQSDFQVLGTDTHSFDDGTESAIVYTSEKTSIPIEQSEQKPESIKKQIVPTKEDTPLNKEQSKSEAVNTDELYKKFEQLLGKTDAYAGDVQELPKEVLPAKIEYEDLSRNTDSSKNEFDFLLKDKLKDENTKEFANKREAIVTLFQEGYTAFMNGDYEKALEAYTGVIDLDKENSMALYSIGTVYAFMKENDNALDYLMRSIDKNKDFARAFDNVGMIYYSQGRFNNAIEYLLRAVQLDSTSVNAFVVLGDSYEQVGNNDMKIRYYKKAARIGDMEAQEFLKEKGFTWE